MKQKLSKLAETNIHLRNEKIKYNNQKNRALKFEKLYKDEKQKCLKLELEIKELRQENETDKHTIEEYRYWGNNIRKMPKCYNRGLYSLYY